VTDIACGTDHLLILTEHGDIYSCGVGTEGQLGRRALKRRELHGTLPEKVILGIDGRKAKRVFAGDHVSFAIDTEGDVWAWGLNGSGPAGIGSSGTRRDPIVAALQKVIGLSQHELRGANVSDIAAGSKHLTLLTNDGRLFTCGESIYARFGAPENDPSLETAGVHDRACVFKLMLVTISEPDDPIVQISTIIDGTLALTAAGSLYVWGSQPNGGPGVKEVDPKGRQISRELVERPHLIVRRVGKLFAPMSVSGGGHHSAVLMRRK
jgi:regulator of chromosome condensation